MIDKQIEYWAHMLDEAFNKDETHNLLTNEVLNEGLTDTTKAIQSKLNTLADSITLFNEMKKYVDNFMSFYKKHNDESSYHISISEFNKNMHEATTAFNEIIDFLKKLIKEKNDSHYSLTKKTPDAKEFFNNELHNGTDVRAGAAAIYFFAYELGKALKYGKDADPFTRRKIPVGADPKDDISWWYSLLRFDFLEKMIYCCTKMDAFEYEVLYRNIF